MIKPLRKQPSTVVVIIAILFALSLFSLFLSAPARTHGSESVTPDLLCDELIVNGDFERADGWTLSPDQAGYSTERAFRGERSLILGLDADANRTGESAAIQTLDLPGDADYILLRAQIWPVSGSDEDLHSLRIHAERETLTIFHEAMESPGWQPLSYNLTPLRGQRVQIRFGVFNNGEGDKVLLRVDAISVEACRPQEHAADAPSIPAADLSRAQPLTDTDEISPTVLLHLPFVQNQIPEPTETPTETPIETEPPTPIIPTAVPCVNLLLNGSFEADTNWIRPVTNGRAAYSTEQVYAGERSLRLGLPDSAANIHTDSTAYQSLQLPADAQKLTLRAQVWRSGTSGDRDFHYLWVIAGGTTYRIFQNLVDADAWQPVEYDLSALAGKRIQVFLGTYNYGTGGKAVMYVDEVSVERCDEGQLPPTPTPTSTHVGTPTATPTPDHAPPADMSSPDFGANAFLWWRSEVADRDLQLLKDGGFRWVRQSFAWEDIEVKSGEFNWENADRVVQQVNMHGLNLMARFGTDPDLSDFWAGKPPQSLDKFVAFVGAVARRYNCTSQAVGCIQAYQIWNEPNLAREWGGNRPNPTQYVGMLKKAYTAIKAANPNAVVISAGMAPTGTDNAIAMPDDKYYREMYKAMGGKSQGYFDMLGVHAPGFAAPPELSPAEVAANPDYGGHRFFAFRHVEDIRSIMVANNDGKTRIAILEFGWTSDPYNPDYYWFGAGAGITEEVKADYLVRAYRYAAEHWQPWIGLMSLLTMPNLDWMEDGDPNDEEQYWWAIMEPSDIDDLHLRPAYVSLCLYLNELREESCPYAPE